MNIWIEVWCQWVKLIVRWWGNWKFLDSSLVVSLEKNIHKLSSINWYLFNEFYSGALSSKREP